MIVLLIYCKPGDSNITNFKPSLWSTLILFYGDAEFFHVHTNERKSRVGGEWNNLNEFYRYEINASLNCLIFFFFFEDICLAEDPYCKIFLSTSSGRSLLAILSVFERYGINGTLYVLNVEDLVLYLTELRSKAHLF